MIKTTAMLLQEYNTYVNPAAKISRMVNKGDLTPIIKGLYESDPTIPGHYLAGIIYGPSYLSFEFALAWHGFIPEAVYTYTSATCGKKRKKMYNTSFGLFTYRDIPIQAFPYGTGLYIDSGYSFVIASPQKAICDFLYTCSPCTNKKDLSQLLFEDLRIDEEAFREADLDELSELASLYRTANHKLLISLIKGVKKRG